MSLTAPPEAPALASPAVERVTVARTVAEVEALRPAWSRLAITNIDADIDYFLTVVNHRREVLRPHVVLIERPERNDLLAVMRLEELPLETRVGYRVVTRPRMRCLLAAFDGIIGAETEDDCRRIVDELRRPLKAGEADVLLLPKLPVGEPLYESARALGPWPCRDHAPTQTGHWTVSIPSSIDEFIAARSSNTRRQSRYHERRLRNRRGDSLQVRRFEREDELDELCAHLEMVAVKTYQRQLGAGFTGDEPERELMALGMRRGWFKAWVVYIDGKPVSFWTGTGYGGTFAIGCPGFDPEYGDERVGLFAMLRMLEDLCVDKAISVLDYGHGEANYKRSYGDDARQEADVLLFAPTPRAVRVNLVRTAGVVATQLAKRLVGDSERAKRLKRAWRERLARQGTAAA